MDEAGSESGRFALIMKVLQSQQNAV